MTKVPLNDNKGTEKEQTDLAWARLQASLAEEPVNPRWAEWGRNTETRESDVTVSQHSEEKTSQTTGDMKEAAREKVAPKRRRKMTRRRKWAATVAGVAALAVILATPIGNTAMAAILNQFRMETVTAVSENDLRDMFYQFNDKGNMHEAVNELGTFKNISGTIGGDMTPAELKEALGYVPPSGVSVSSTRKLSVTPSQEITLDLNVNKTNDFMKRLGAVKLLPESVDGKPITLHVPESVYYELAPEGDGWANLQQMKTPVLTVDPSIQVDEALDAVINFPLLPDTLKTSLQQSQILSGEIPMPVFVSGNAEQVQVGNATVILEHDSSGKYFHAVWIKDGQLFNFTGGTLFNTREKVMAKVQEMIQP